MKCMLLLPLGSSVSETLIFRALFTKTGNKEWFFNREYRLRIFSLWDFTQSFAN
jgi:hypothetical protein